MSTEDELRELLTEAAQELASAHSNPRTWLSWIVYLLGRLEEQAAQSGPSDRATFMEMLSALQDAIRNRSRTGGWN